MTATRITELLPIPEGVRKPHAYQVFGLEEGEQDNEAIKRAVKEVVTQLKSAKADTDAKLWSKAAKMVQEAREILSDPEKKAQLDARFGIFAIENDPVETVKASPAADPLAGVLPAADPLAAMLPSSNPLAPVATDTASQTFPTSPSEVAPQRVPPPSTSEPVAPSAADPIAPAAQDSFAPVASSSFHVEKPAPRRRRRSMTGTLVFVTFSLGMIAVIGLLSYFLFFSSGQVAITNTDGQISISTKEPDGETMRVSPPASSGARESRPVDPVMGALAGNVKPPPRTPSGLTGNGGEASTNSDADGTVSVDSDMTANGDAEMATTADSDMSDTAMSDTAMTDTAMTDTPGTAADPENPPAEMSPDQSAFTAPDPEMTEPGAVTEEMIAAAEQKIESVRGLIREAKWKEMKGAAEALSELPMSEDQAAEAEALYELADLATYYRVGIERAVSELNTGDDFAVTDSFRVIVVEKGEDLLVVRYNEKNRSFTFDEFPFSLAQKLGTFSMPDSPTTQAAKAVYQAIAPKATDAHREQAIDWLRGIDGEVEGADVDRLIKTIEVLFGEDA